MHSIYVYTDTYQGLKFANSCIYIYIYMHNNFYYKVSVSTEWLFIQLSNICVFEVHSGFKCHLQRLALVSRTQIWNAILKHQQSIQIASYATQNIHDTEDNKEIATTAIRRQEESLENLVTAAFRNSAYATHVRSSKHKKDGKREEVGALEAKTVWL